MVHIFMYEVSIWNQYEDCGIERNLVSKSLDPWTSQFVIPFYLQGQPEVLHLLDPNSPWVRGAPPKYIRALLYKYHFTNWGESF
jgi:hypothetical protein